MRLVLVDVNLVSGKERLPDNMDLPIINNRTFQEDAKVYKYGRRMYYTYTVGVGHLIAIKRPGISVYIQVKILGRVGFGQQYMGGL
jgi:hypothetical protein